MAHDCALSNSIRSNRSRATVSLLHQPAWSAVRTLQAAFVVTRTCRVPIFPTVVGPGVGAVLKKKNLDLPVIRFSALTSTRDSLGRLETL